jgi:hypothetical protein
MGEKKMRALQVVLKSKVRTVLEVYEWYYNTLDKRVQAHVLVYCPLDQGLLSIRKGGPLVYKFYCTHKRMNRLQYSVVQMQDRIHRKLCLQKLILI